jgi:hypothetical protein
MTTTNSTTPKKNAANRKNAALSTGPKTAAGKLVASKNALVHGLRSVAPVVPGESAEDWEAHRAGIVAALAPVGTLEAELAERVASLAWRLRRATAYETGAVRSASEKAVAALRDPKPPGSLFEGMLARHGLGIGRLGYGAVKQALDKAHTEAEWIEWARDQFRNLADLPDSHPFGGADATGLLEEAAAYGPNDDDAGIDLTDPSFVTAAGLPVDLRVAPDEWDGWTATHVRAGLNYITERHRVPLADLLADAVRGTEQAADAKRKKVALLEAELARLEPGLAAEEDMARRMALIPAQTPLDVMIRYETHISRQLTQTLHLLERLQAARYGTPPAPPAALDVTVDGLGDGV